MDDLGAPYFWKHPYTYNELLHPPFGGVKSLFLPDHALMLCKNFSTFSSQSDSSDSSLKTGFSKASFRVSRWNTPKEFGDSYTFGEIVWLHDTSPIDWGKVDTNSTA